MAGPLLSAVLTGLSIWLGAQPALSRRVGPSRTLRQWLRAATTAPGHVHGRNLLIAAVIVALVVGLGGMGWWQLPVLVVIARRMDPALAARAAAGHNAAVRAAMPDVWVLFAACQQAGVSVRESVRLLADTVPGRAGDELRAMRAALLAGKNLSEAVAATSADSLKRGCKLLVQAEAVGSPIAPLLHRLAQQASDELRWQQHAAHARLPLALTLITVGCFMPGVLVVTVLPHVIGFLAHMQ